MGLVACCSTVWAKATKKAHLVAPMITTITTITLYSVQQGYPTTLGNSAAFPHLSPNFSLLLFSCDIFEMITLNVSLQWLQSHCKYPITADAKCNRRVKILRGLHFRSGSGSLSLSLSLWCRRALPPMAMGTQLDCPRKDNKLTFGTGYQLQEPD